MSLPNNKRAARTGYLYYLPPGVQYDEPWKGFRLDGQTLVLSLGMALDGATGRRRRIHVSVRLAEALPGWFDPEKVRQLRIVKEGRQFYAVFTVGRQMPSRRAVKRVIAIARTRSTHTCHVCGHLVPEGIPPEVRAWRRQACGKEHTRDENAALNGLKRVLEKLEVPGSGHLGDGVIVTTRRAWRFGGSGIAEAMPRATDGRVDITPPAARKSDERHDGLELKTCSV